MLHPSDILLPWNQLRDEKKLVLIRSGYFCPKNHHRKWAQLALRVGFRVYFAFEKWTVSPFCIPVIKSILCALVDATVCLYESPTVDIVSQQKHPNGSRSTYTHVWNAALRQRCLPSELSVKCRAVSVRPSELSGAIFMAGRQVCRNIHRQKIPRLFTWSEIKAKFYGRSAWDRLLRLSYVHCYRSYYQLISLMPD